MIVLSWVMTGSYWPEFAGQEAPEVVKTPGVRPAVERAGRALHVIRRHVPLAEVPRAVPVALQHADERRAVFRAGRGVARERTRQLADRPEAHGVVVAAGAHQVGGDQNFHTEQQGPTECLAQYQVSLGRPARPPHGHHRQHERPDHANDQDRSPQRLETLGNVIHRRSERLSRRPGGNRGEDHVPLPRMPSPQLAQSASSFSPANSPGAPNAPVMECRPLGRPIVRQHSGRCYCLPSRLRRGVAATSDGRQIRGSVSRTGQ